MKKIAIDAMGGDFAPKAIVEGAVLAASLLPEDYQIVLIGKQEALLDSLHGLDYPKGSIEMVFASDVIEMHEHPTRAFSQKPNSSIGVGFKLLKDKHEASENNVEMQCLAFTCNVLVDILDEIKEILEPTSDKKV